MKKNKSNWTAWAVSVAASLTETSAIIAPFDGKCLMIKSKRGQRSTNANNTIQQQMFEAIFMATLTFTPSVTITAIFAIEMRMTLTVRIGQGLM